jgi:hypothetical protein
MSRAPAVPPPVAQVAAPLSRPNLVDWLLILAGVSLSFFLMQFTYPTDAVASGTPAKPSASPTKAEPGLGRLRIRPKSWAARSPWSETLAALPDAVRLPEGIILLWPVLHTLQRLLGRKQGLTAAEWLWVFAWLGTAALVGLAVWHHFRPLPDGLKGWPPVIWYVVVIPSMALVALIVALLGVVGSAHKPWTHNLGVALVVWPVVPLAGILALGDFHW